MIGITIILLFCVYLVFLFPDTTRAEEKPAHSARYTAQMRKLWQIAQDSMKERKPLRAEKALLTILKFDEKNAAAYNRLGILYAKSQKFDEAIECFEIAQSLDDNPSSLHNAGLIYLETGAYEKAAMAFEQAIKLEGDLPARFIALAKAKEKLGKRKEAIDALESAYELDRSANTLRQILAIYESAGDAENIAATTARIERHITDSALAKQKKSRSSTRSRSNTRSTSRPTTRTRSASTTRTPSRRKVI
ncbi:tetratricopeptide repeat protein [Candidatus Saccharibacteria bacterium]|nr:tetratricopeptide repeat protein [Candidatus Saccharibacteria bacterium]